MHLSHYGLLVRVDSSRVYVTTVFVVRAVLLVRADNDTVFRSNKNVVFDVRASSTVPGGRRAPLLQGTVHAPISHKHIPRHLWVTGLQVPQHLLLLHLSDEALALSHGSGGGGSGADGHRVLTTQRSPVLLVRFLGQLVATPLAGLQVRGGP